MGWSRDPTATLNVSNVGSVTTNHGSLFQYTTAAGGKKRVFVIVHRCVNLTQCEGWLCLVILEGCSKYCGKGIATNPCIILKSIITLASALLCSSVLSPS